MAKKRPPRIRDLPHRAFEEGGAVTRLLRESGFVDPPMTVINNNQWWDLSQEQLRGVVALLRPAALATT